MNREKLEKIGIAATIVSAGVGLYIYHKQQTAAAAVVTDTGVPDLADPLGDSSLFSQPTILPASGDSTQNSGANITLPDVPNYGQTGDSTTPIDTSPTPFIPTQIQPTPVQSAPSQSSGGTGSGTFFQAPGSQNTATNTGAVSIANAGSINRRPGQGSAIPTAGTQPVTAVPAPVSTSAPATGGSGSQSFSGSGGTFSGTPAPIQRQSSLAVVRRPNEIALPH